MDSQQTMRSRGIVMNVEGKQDGIAHNVLTIKMTRGKGYMDVPYRDW